MDSLPEYSTKVLVIEDELDLREALASYLRLDGLTTESAASLKEADALMNDRHYDVVLLDLGLPDGDGLEWLQQRSDLTNTGLIITSARGTKAQRISGIRCGADAYFVKPVDLEELSLHVVNLARRLNRQKSRGWELHEVDWKLISITGTTVKLTRSEVHFLKPLMQNPGHPIGRDVLIAQLGHNQAYYDTRRMEIMVRRLRKKIESQCGEPLPVETVYGRGFAFTAEATILEM